MSGNQKERVGRGPNIRDLRRFDKASLEIDPTDDEQYRGWAKAAQRLSDKGWKPKQVIERLWTLRPDFRTPGLSPEVAVGIAVQEQRGQGRETIGPEITLHDEIEFHGSIIQTAALMGEQVVVRGRRPSMEDLPSHVYPAERRWPGYVDPVVFASAVTQSRKPQDK